MYNDLICSLRSTSYLLIKILRLFKIITISKGSLDTINNLSQNRLNDELYSKHLEVKHLPFIDVISISINNTNNIKKFLQSLAAQSYPLNFINLYLVDNLEDTNITTIFEEFIKDFKKSFNHIQIDYYKNIPCELAYDFSIKKGRAKYIALLDMGIELEKNSINEAIFTAENSSNDIASWELRRIPIEDSKYYDPVTLETPWSSWTAIMIRRQHCEHVGGFEQNYNITRKDIELSYRFRTYGFKLKYCPAATFLQYNKLSAKEVINCEISRSVGVNIETKKLTIKPLVTVIMRTTQQRLFSYLRQSILTVINQTYDNIELIIVEDGSEVHKKNCQQLCTSFKLSYKYFNIPKVGRARAGNYGLAVSSGEYLMFLDDDDYLFADHIETIISNLLNNTSAVAGYSLSWEGKIDKSAAYFKYRDLTIPHSINQEYDFNILKIRNFIPIQSIIFSKQLFIERGGFETELDYLEDWNLWYRYGYNNIFQFIPKVTSIYVITDNILELIKRNRNFKQAYSRAKQLAEDSIKNYL